MSRKLGEMSTRSSYDSQLQQVSLHLSIQTLGARRLPFVLLATPVQTGSSLLEYARGLVLSERLRGIYKTSAHHHVANPTLEIYFPQNDHLLVHV
jgi:hypothetical protein